MVDIQDFMAACLNMTEQELADYAWERYKPVRDYLEPKYGIKDTDDMVFDALSTICAIDGNLTDGEYEILRNIHGFCYAEQKDIERRVKRHNNQRDIQKTVNFGKSLPYDERLSFICLAIAILAVDSRYTDNELALLHQLLRI